MTPRPILRLLSGAALALGGCSTPSHLVFHQSTAIGVDVATSTQTGQVHVGLGYDRQTNTLIPETTVKTPNGPEKEAMSVISTSKATIQWLGAHEVTEQFATGTAAVNLAAKPESVAEVLTLTQPTRKVDAEVAR